MGLLTHTLRAGKKGSKTGYKVLLSSLKDQASEPAIKRVDEILSLLVVAEGYRRDQLEYLDRFDQERIVGEIPEFLDRFRRMKESERAYLQSLELLNITLSRYRWEASLEGDLYGFRSELVPSYPKDRWAYSGRPRFDYTELREYSDYTESFLAQRDELLAQVGHTQHSEERARSSGWDSSELFMVGQLLEAVNQGEIWRFRRCSDCRHWFYAIRGHQHFCGEVCRRRHEAQNPAFKEKRRKYMRERYRPQEKEREKRSIALARGERTKEAKE